MSQKQYLHSIKDFMKTKLFLLTPALLIATKVHSMQQDNLHDYLTKQHGLSVDQTEHSTQAGTGRVDGSRIIIPSFSFKNPLKKMHINGTSISLDVFYRKLDKKTSKFFLSTCEEINNRSVFLSKPFIGLYGLIGGIGIATVWNYYGLNNYLS
jgi:hypothetical protein